MAVTHAEGATFVLVPRQYIRPGSAGGAGAPSGAVDGVPGGTSQTRLLTPHLRHRYAVHMSVLDTVVKWMLVKL